MSERQNRGWARASPSMLKRIVKRIKVAFAEDEKAYETNGFLSHHAETQAMGMGFAAGFYATALGNTRFLALVYAAAVYGQAHARNGKRRAILNDIKSQPHYALGGILLGGVLGIVAEAIQAIVDVNVPTIPDFLPALLFAAQHTVMSLV